jgi:uncharacterized protein (TIGR02678 family)
MPAAGTASHVTLLVAEFLSGAAREAPDRHVDHAAVATFVRDATAEYGRYWSKAAREPGAEAELARNAIERLAALRLVRCDEAGVRALPALARFALGKAQLIVRKQAGAPRSPAAAQTDLF